MDYDESASAERTSSDEWSMEEIPANQKQKGTGLVVDEPVNKSTKKGDWSLEEVDTDPGKDRLKFSEKSSDTEPNQKKTRKGDWEIEEKKGSDKN